MVEMRDAEAFQIKLGIEHEIFSKISLEQLVIFRFENVERQRIAAFLDGVNKFFEFGKHRLSEQGAAQIVDFPVDNVSPHLRIVRSPKQVMRKQFLVKRRCDFREKDRILVVLKELRSLREPAVHRVTSLVRERIHIREYVL